MSRKSPRMEPAPALERRAWETPSLHRVGKVTDIVQGAGKSGPNVDGDPGAFRKMGMG